MLCGQTSGSSKAKRNMMASLSSDLILFFFHTLRSCRKVEDKLTNFHIETRHFFVPMDLSEVHCNRGMPAGFTMYLCVGDASLPSKGTAHRANRAAEKVLCLNNFPIVFF